jgi:hypothetical protein
MTTSQLVAQIEGSTAAALYLTHVRQGGSWMDISAWKDQQEPSNGAAPGTIN